MATLHGAPLPEDFKDGNQLTAAEFNAVKNYWVTDELPDTAENGDVVFVADGGVVSDAGGGKVLQVVRATDGNNHTTNNTSWEPVPGMSVSITPKSSNSTILVICTFRANIESSTTTSMRAAAGIFDEDGNNLSGTQSSAFGMERFDRTGGNTIIQHTVSMFGYAAPATTNQVTYEMQVNVPNSDAALTIRNRNQTGQLYAIELADVVVSP